MDQDLEKRLAAARAKREEAEAQREARATEREMLAKVEAAEREADDAVAIARAEDEYGADKLAALRTELGVVIVKRPPAMHYRRFLTKGLSDKMSPDDAERLVLSCLVHPSKARFEEIADELPAVPMLAAGLVSDLAAGRKADLAGKS